MYLCFLYMNFKYLCVCVSVVCNGVKEIIIIFLKWNYLFLFENFEIKYFRVDFK